MLTYLLYDFISYIRSVMNNYRLFKMQIREAELLGLAYLDYLINGNLHQKLEKRLMI